MLYDVKFNMNAQTWLLTYCWLFLLGYFFLPGGGIVQKGVKPYAYVMDLGMTTDSYTLTKSNNCRQRKKFHLTFIL